MVFKTEQKSLNDAIATLSKQKMTVTAGTTGARTLSADEFVDGVFTQADGGAAANITTPTAAAIVAAIKGCEVGTSFDFILRNLDAADAMTLVGGSGVTVVGTATAAAASCSHFKGVVTNVGTPAVLVFRS
jgi:hypothetical protein